MNAIERLIKTFSEFPGIGPKQARRFVYFLITRSPSYIESLKKDITELRGSVTSCADCHRYFPAISSEKFCRICADDTRDTGTLIIVSRDVDLENIEKSGSYLGKYFVLGGLVPILDKEPEKRIRLAELLAIVSRNAEKGLKEIVLGLDANPEGEYTADFLKTTLKPLTEKYTLSISEFGRGLSTGTELEYSDPETIKNALRNRK